MCDYFFHLVVASHYLLGGVAFLSRIVSKVNGLSGMQVGHFWKPTRLHPIFQASQRAMAEEVSQLSKDV